MKKTLLIMVMALAVLLTQCRKPEVKFPSPVAPEGTTVSMTVTAGPGSKTDITHAGGITWSTGDKLYVGDGSKYIGYLTIVSGVGTPTGTFSGDVTLPNGTTGEKTFHFFYLGSNPPAVTSGASSVEVSFATQTGLCENLGSCHVGYGSAKGTVTNGIVTGINVTLVSKVALARFSFTESDSKGAYKGALMLGGEHIYNKMTVSFDSREGFDFTPTRGYISLTNTTSSEKYVMLVPTGSTEAETLNFVVDVAGKTTLENGIESNKFYGRDGAIEVTVKPVEFSVGSGTKVTFAPGNLWYDGSAFRFEANQWSFEDSWNSSHVSHFYWSKSADVAVAEEYVDASESTKDNFFTNADETTANTSFHVNGETGTNQWRTLSMGEMEYLLNTSGSSGRMDANRFAKAKVNGVSGLLIFPDGYTLPEGYTTAAGGTGMAALNDKYAAYPTDDDIPTDTWSAMETAGAVFLPAAGGRDCTDVGEVGSFGGYWSSTLSQSGDATGLAFSETSLSKELWVRFLGISVRLVR